MTIWHEMPRPTATPAADERPPGWREAIAAALRAAPQVSPALAETVAGLFGTALVNHLATHAAPQPH